VAMWEDPHGQTHVGALVSSIKFMIMFLN